MFAVCSNVFLCLSSRESHSNVNKYKHFSIKLQIKLKMRMIGVDNPSFFRIVL